MPPAAIQNLTERRVPQFIAIYLGASWGLVQFVDFISSRYGMSPRWTDLTLLAMVLLLPSVLLYTYHHGRPGPDEWQKSEKIFIPLNIIALIGILTLAGTTTNLSAVTTTVKIKDEKGNTVERVVANKAYRKRVALFEFDNAAGTDKWLSLAPTLLTAMDLEQQQFIQSVPSIGMKQRLLEAGYKEGTGVPLSLKRELAEERHIPYFVAGTIQQTTTGVTARVQLYETATAKKISEHTFTGPTVADIADMMSENLIKDLDIPVITDDKPNMQVAELTTQNAQAMRYCMEAIQAAIWKNDYAGGKALLDKAAAADPTFAMAQMQRWSFATVVGAQKDAQAAIQSSLDHNYRLPERTRHFVKYYYYIAKQDYPHAFAVVDMLSQLYPEDIEVLEAKVQVASVRDDKDGAIASLNKMLELDPTQSDKILRLGNLYEAKGDAPNALKQYERYTSEHNNISSAHVTLANLYRKTGDATKAKNAYEQALLVKPNDIPALVSAAGLDRELGDFASAENKLEQAFAAAKTAADSSVSLRGMARLQLMRGQIAKSVGTTQQALSASSGYLPPLQVTWDRLVNVAALAKLDPAKAQAEVRRLEQQGGPMVQMLAPIAEVGVYWEAKDSAGVQRAAAGVDDLIKKTSMKAYQYYAVLGYGHAAELRNDCATALRFYENVQKLDPLDVAIQRDIGRCYRKSNQFAKAQEALARVLRVWPADGEANLEMALLLKQSGDLTKAKQFAAVALKTWQSADASFRQVAEARAI
ncbi:MAG TPA: tetratricopeptide repeat protein [Longimicrobiales bacterium]|nr:tetratricopeptide repeat protein [Longimicrobiales bacterium]